MKTLKFMLAAATAIGLASATQADQYNTTGFEKLTAGDPVTTGVEDNRDGYSYFYYAGSEAADNESVIAAGTPDIARPRGVSTVDATRNNILQVSTGTDPLLRTYQGFMGSSPVAATALASDVYVDTLVQFTVTPYTDTVTPGDSDKLMIYLKESVITNEFGEITSASTNLVVIGGYMVDDGVFEPKEYKITGVNIEPNTWHRLTVKVIANYGALEDYYHPAFLIYLDGVSDPCVLDDLAIAEAETDTGYVAPFDDDSLTLTELDEKNLVFSLKCDSQTAATLQGVGFAGEGKVDDIVFSDLNPFATVFDFTFVAWDEKVTAVSYTVGEASGKDQPDTYEVEEGTKIKIDSITYASGWQEGSFTVTGLADPDLEGWYTVTNTASITIVPAEAAAADWEADPTEIADNTPASTQYPTLAGTPLEAVDAKKLTVWAKANSVTFEAAGEATAESVTVEAFMLNCAPTAEAVEAAEEDFKATITVNADGTISVTAPEGYNVVPQLQGKATLDAASWTDIPAASSTYKFYRFELRLPTSN